MEKEIKGTEKVDVNNGLQAINEDDLGEVAGGGLVDTIKEKWQRFRMSRKEKEEIESLINEYDSLSYWVRKRSVVLAYGGPRWFDESSKSMKRLEEVGNKLKAYAGKYDHISELKRFR